MTLNIAKINEAIKVMNKPVIKARPNEIVPPNSLSLYDLIPKNIKSRESIITEYPIISEALKTVLSSIDLKIKNGIKIRITITPPEINPYLIDCLFILKFLVQKY